jgi:hypothetical protein
MSLMTAPVREPSDSLDELVGRLQRQLDRRFRKVRVQARGTGLVLKGLVSTYYAKQIAQHLIMQMTSVPIIANEIEVL